MPRTVCLVLSGGVALGSYHAGVYDALHGAGCDVSWIAGSSIGAINGALITGTSPERRTEVLRSYWLSAAPWAPLARNGPLRHAFNWMNVAQARFLGSPRHLRIGGLGSIYDLRPTADFLEEAVDFGRLNSGDTRFTVATVDIESGRTVFFDSAKERIGIDHILASCGFLPEFAPVEILGRLLGDGGLAVNAPFEPILDELEGTDITVLISDLFARDGVRPRSLQEALERKSGLIFGNQTYARLDIYRRFWERHGICGPSIIYLSYQPAPDEAGPEAPFDFSRISAEDRWRSGALDAAGAIAELEPSLPLGKFVSIRRNLQSS